MHFLTNLSLNSILLFWPTRHKWRKILALIFMGMLLPTAHAAVYPLREGNQIEFMSDPRAAVDEKLAMIRNAKHHIHIMTFYWDDSPVGLEFALAVREALERGVEVRVLASLIPTVVTDPKLSVRDILEPPTASGQRAHLHFIGPVAYPFGLWDIIHEKLLLVDGKVAVIGGRNLSSFIYSARDWEFQVEGPLVQDLQRHFKKMLDYVVQGRAEQLCGKRRLECRDELLHDLFDDDDVYFASYETFFGGVTARLLTHEAPLEAQLHDDVRREKFLMNDDIVSALVTSEAQHIRLYNYFLLHTPAMKAYISESSHRGRTVEIITNSLESSAYLSELGYRVALPYAAQLADNDPHIYLWTPANDAKYLHVKAAILDLDHAFVGSHNYTTGSTSVSTELAIEFWSEALVSQLVSVFDSDKTEHCKKGSQALFQSQLDDTHLGDEIKERLFRSVILKVY